VVAEANDRHRGPMVELNRIRAQQQRAFITQASIARCPMCWTPLQVGKDHFC